MHFFFCDHARAIWFISSLGFLFHSNNNIAVLEEFMGLNNDFGTQKEPHLSSIVLATWWRCGKLEIILFLKECLSTLLKLLIYLIVFVDQIVQVLIIGQGSLPLKKPKHRLSSLNWKEAFRRGFDEMVLLSDGC